jgi:inosine/xanthosine triphosphatase
MAKAKTASIEISYMKKAIIAVGSTRKPKLDAVRDALRFLGSSLAAGLRYEIEGIDVTSGVRQTPLSREETMDGARQRAEALVRIAREQKKPWKYFIGLEGGLDVIHQAGHRWVFLENWTFITDGVGCDSFGHSGGVLLPESLVRRVVDDGVDLSEAIDALAGARGIRDGQGAWGVLTHNRITRRDAIRMSVVNAFAPFLAQSADLRAPGAKS